MKYGRKFLPGGGGGNISADESDLVSDVFQSAMKMLSGSASRNELAGELSDKLYAGRADAGDMAELGIEVVKAGPDPSAPAGSPGTAPGRSRARTVTTGKSVPSPKPLSVPNAFADGGQFAVFGKLWARARPFQMELALVPGGLVGLFVVRRFRRRGKKNAFVLPEIMMQLPADSEPYDMKHALQPLKAEEFELLVALVYQRQGYRVSMPAGLSGGRGGDFTLARKAERVLVQCKKLTPDHKVPVERVRELHESMMATGATRGLYVVACGFSWDARNFAKANNITAINARTLDELLTAARENPEEDLLAVAHWAPKFLSRVELTTPCCPACEAPMDQLNVTDSSVWVCSQRPECRGRRSGRKYQKPEPAARQRLVTADAVPA